MAIVSSDLVPITFIDPLVLAMLPQPTFVDDNGNGYIATKHLVDLFNNKSKMDYLNKLRVEKWINMK